MNMPPRFGPAVRVINGVAVPGVTVEPEGDLVLFAHVEQALRDQRRLAWLMPVMAGDDEDPEVAYRAGALAAGLTMGLRGNALVDMAMETANAR